MKIDITRLVKKIVKERAKSSSGSCYDDDDYGCGSNSNAYNYRCGGGSSYGGRC